MDKTGWFSLAFVVLVLSAGLYFSYDKRTTLAECHEIVPGVVTKKYKPHSKPVSVHYKYQVDERTYKGSETVMGKRKLAMVSLGGAVRVKVGCARRVVSEICFGE